METTSRQVWHKVLERDELPEGRVKAKTLEGAVRALLDLHKLRSQKRELVTTETAQKAIEMAGEEGEIPEPAEAKKLPTPKDEMSADELALLARQLAAGRAGVELEEEDGPEQEQEEGSE